MCYHNNDTTALQGDYEGLWEIPLDQVQPSPAECSSEPTASPPSYNHTAPPPPYTAHARLGEVSIHRSYHYDPPAQDHVIGDNDQRGDTDQAAMMGGWISDDHNDATRHTDPSYHVEQQVPMETSEQETYHEEQSNINQYPLATSTPTSSQCELQHSANSNIFIKPLLPLNNNLPPVKAIPRLRPIRPQTLSAPNLFVSSHPPLAAHDIDSTLNNTLPRVGHLPPLRRKPNMTYNSPRHVRSLSDGQVSSPYYDNALSRNMSATGEYEAISEVSCEPSSNDAIDNL